MEEWEKTVHESRHSYFPVCGESIDDVLGILSAKDYFRLSREGVSQAEILKKSIRPASFVPNTIKADVLFRNMKKSGNYFAVVLDEYGGVDGIITLRDLIEQLVGDLNEEEDGIPVEDIVQLTDNSWKIQGLTSLDDVQEALGVPLPSTSMIPSAATSSASWGRSRRITASLPWTPVPSISPSSRSKSTGSARRWSSWRPRRSIHRPNPKDKLKPPDITP